MSRAREALELEADRLRSLLLQAIKSTLTPRLEAAPDDYGPVHALLQQLPADQHGIALRALREMNIPRPSFQHALTWVWASGGGEVVAQAAGTRSTLVEWFRFARYSWPASPPLAEAVTAYAAPEVTLYRAGYDAPSRLAAGLSWTPFPAVAVLLGCSAPGADHTPALVRRAVQRRDVLVAWTAGTQEHVVAALGPYEAEQLGPDRLAELLAQGRELQAQHLVQKAEFEARWQRFLGGGGSASADRHLLLPALQEGLDDDVG